MRKALILFTFLMLTACANKQVLVGKKCMQENDGEFIKTTKSYIWFVDKTQDKDLDPWVQSVTINTGKSSNFHKIFKTGQPVPKNLTQIWDILSEQKINCAIWWTMNTYFKKNKNIKIFFSRSLEQAGKSQTS